MSGLEVQCQPLIDEHPFSEGMFVRSVIPIRGSGLGLHCG